MQLTGAAVEPGAFAAAMAAFAPFEPQPTVAVGVSGGPDSLALTLLLDTWIRPLGGAVLAFTVDHGLRPEAAAEARKVGAWLAARGIAHEILDWTGDKPGTGIQAAARQARYALLAEACAARGILHLAIAHHADDQAETVLFRQERGSGPEGLAGMTASRSLGSVRLIRPLLAWSKDRLVATCAAFGQPFIEDPSNRSPDYARPILRQRLAGDPSLRDTLLETALYAGKVRHQLGKTVASILGRITTIGPEGIVFIDRAGLIQTPEKLRHAVMSAALRTVGGGIYAPGELSLAALDRMLQTQAFPGASLGGCLIRLWRGTIMICREAGRTAAPISLSPGRRHRWDGRFALRTEADGLTVGALGPKAWAALNRHRKTPLPAVAGAGLPAVFKGKQVISIPAIAWCQDASPEVDCSLLPLWPLAAETFTVVSAGADIMSDRGGRSRRY